MIRRVIKLMLYVKAPVKAFTLFHPVKAARLWLAYVLGSALFGARKRVEAAEPPASGWGGTVRPAGPDAARATRTGVAQGNGAGDGAPGRAGPGAGNAGAAAVPDGSDAGAAGPLPAGASAGGHEPAQ